MPEQTTAIAERKEWAENDDRQLPYVSKSRLKTFKQCEELFRYKYLVGLDEPENFYMRRGTTIHEVIEDYYHALIEFVSATGRGPSSYEIVSLLPSNHRWTNYVEPFITNFVTWEQKRFDRVPDPELALPTGIEKEGWWEKPLGIGDDLPDGVEEAGWMGFADAVFHGEAFGYPEGSGKVIVDFKTGSVPDEKYRDEGIHLEGEYYGMIFEAAGMNVEAVAGYYPKEGIGGTYIEAPSSPQRRETIRQAVTDMQLKTASEPTELAISEGPLCRYGPEPSDGCAFATVCRQTWSTPVENEEQFAGMVDKRLSDGQIAERLDMNDSGPVSYWKYKLNLT